MNYQLIYNQHEYANHILARFHNEKCKHKQQKNAA